MPRDGSQSNPPAGAVPSVPVNIGDVADPPFAVVPDPGALFGRRADRFEALAGRGGDLQPFLQFLSRLCRAQHEILSDLPPPRFPDQATLDLAREHGMPPLGRIDVADDPVALQTFDALLARLKRLQLPAGTLAALETLEAAGADARTALLSETLDGEVTPARIAEHVLAAAALQVHFARLAGKLDPDTLQKITDGACPACGGPPVASTVVTWDGASNARYCACPTCATQWHVVRVRCLSCGQEKDITFHSLEGSDEAAKAETCRGCKTYLKIFYQAKDSGVEPVADDVASLSLDLLLEREGYARAGSNPFLIGY